MGNTRELQKQTSSVILSKTLSLSRLPLKVGQLVVHYLVYLVA